MFDVIVCGAGVQGLWTANHLAERKKKIILLEQVSIFSCECEEPDVITKVEFVL